ncbi:hypothetical protein VTI74DRAFT_9490 [Chaetomium olivicolor]
MLSAGIAALRRAARQRALAQLRLNQPAIVILRRYSRTDRLSTSHGDALSWGPSPADPFASVINAARQAEKAEQDLELAVPTGVFEPVNAEAAAKLAEKSSVKPKRPKASVDEGSWMDGDPNDPFASVLVAVTEATKAEKEQNLEVPAGVFEPINPKPPAPTPETERLDGKHKSKARREKGAKLGALWVGNPQDVAAAVEALRGVDKAMQTVHGIGQAQSLGRNLQDSLTQVLDAAERAKHVFEALDYSECEVRKLEDQPTCDLKRKLREERYERKLRDAFKKMTKVAALAKEAMRQTSKDQTLGVSGPAQDEFPDGAPKTRRKRYQFELLAAERAFGDAVRRLEVEKEEMERPPKDDKNDQGHLDEQHRFPVLELPTDPAKLKALPKGFHAMTDIEQQEELWIVEVEDRLGREWELPEPGKHVAYVHDYPPYSPSKIIGILHRWRNKVWTPHQWQLARAIAGNRSLRFPVLTAQAFLRRHTLLARRRGVELKMERYLGGTEEWKSRVAQLEDELGVGEADIKQWLWILSPESGDVQVQRFLQSECRKPLFLLHLLLAKDRQIREPASFLGLIQYIRENYVLADRPQDELNHPAYQGQGRSMTWWHYLVFLYRLVWHCREGWPAAMPVLARLTADYIGTMRLETRARALTGYQARSLVLNKALQYFSWPARIRPIDHMEHNWAAQRHLLRLAATAEPPLVMDKTGYRGVRSVLIALQKTKGEAKNADRAARTWPPYRRTFDGIDERRNPEDDLSRSVKAGMLVRAAGYSDDIVDRALSALGGSTFGQAPTIQTRSLPPPFYSGERSSQNIQSEWAAQVRATRNAREAWVVFGNPPEPGIRPSAQVYSEMFEKLYARKVTESPVIRPGDVKEVFPVYDGNLSEFEIARLTPPTPEELYDMMMLHDKVKPSSHCLVVLIRNAPSKMAALRYLSDSPHEPCIQALREPVSQASVETLKKLAELPIPLFNAWITMLCRIHTRAPREENIMGDSLRPAVENADLGAAPSGGSTGRDRRARDVSLGGSILEAIELATKFQRYNGKAANHDKAPWLTIMQALAGPKMLYSRLGTEFNILETLTTFLQVYERTTLSKGTDPVSFEALCVMIRKTMKIATFVTVDGNMVPRSFIAGNKVLEKVLAKAHRLAVKAFAELAKPLAVPEELQDGVRESEEGDEFDIDDFEAELAEAEAAGEGYDKTVNEDNDATGANTVADSVGISHDILRYNIVGRPLHRYMVALGCCGDHVEMVRLMDWVLDGWDRDYIREDAKTAHNLDYHYMMRTIAYFAEMGRELVDPAEMERLRTRLEDMRARKGCTWFWPGGEEEKRWQRQQQQSPEDGSLKMLPELETDLVIVQKWLRLRQMVTFKSAAVEGAASLAEIHPELPLTTAEGGGEEPERAAGSG